mmetsp:Transcript_1932/g.4119  ORF Transcript_1932/g.4119 Transcript_1932/m.4119 type:complete len:216 (-) Transcript_1932:401-1048(-)
MVVVIALFVCAFAALFLPKVAVIVISSSSSSAHGIISFLHPVIVDPSFPLPLTTIVLISQAHFVSFAIVAHEIVILSAAPISFFALPVAGRFVVLLLALAVHALFAFAAVAVLAALVVIASFAVAFLASGNTLTDVGDAFVGEFVCLFAYVFDAIHAIGAAFVGAALLNSVFGPIPAFLYFVFSSTTAITGFFFALFDAAVAVPAIEARVGTAVW